MVIHDKDTGEIIEGNYKACEVYGRTFEELKTLVIGDLTTNVPPYTHERGMQKLQEALESEQGCIFEWVVRHAQGAEMPVEVNAKRITVGGVERVIAIARDITDRKIAERLLQEKEEHFRQLIENSNDGVAILGKDGAIAYVGPSIKHMLGVSPRRITGRSVFDFVAESDARRVAETLAALKSEASLSLRYKIQDIQGEWKIHEAHCRNLIKAGVHQGILVNFRDITERVRAEETARDRGYQLNRIARISTIGEMATALVHELSQPFAAIVNFLAGSRRRLMADTYDREELLHVLQLAQKEAERAGKVIHSIRHFTDSRHSQSRRFGLRRLVEESSELLDIMASRASVRISYQLDERPCWVDCDDVLMQQVILNLVQNGIEALEPRAAGSVGLVIQVCRRPMGKIVLMVTDSGKGLPNVNPDRLFASFYSTKKNGLGIGLSLCKSIIEAANGHIWVTAWPRKTTFHVLLAESQPLSSVMAPMPPGSGVQAVGQAVHG
jgi:two-component system sensor kinase FixL